MDRAKKERISITQNQKRKNIRHTIKQNCERLLLGGGGNEGFIFLEIILRMRSVLCLVMGCDVM
jgi:hypothetical protein